MRTMTSFFLFAGLAIAAALPLLADAPASVPAKPTMAEVLSGKVVPLTLQLKDMASGWSTFTGDSSDSSMLLGMMRNSAVSHPMLSLLSARYTRGQTVELGGETFLVAYGRSNAPMMNQLMGAGRGQGQEQVDPLALFQFTPETEVTLQLLNVRTMGNLNDIHLFNLQELTSKNTALLQGQLTARETTSLSQLRQIAVATQMYIQDNNGNLPPVDTLAHFQDAVLAYLGNNHAMVVQPGTGTPYQPNLALAGKKEANFNNPTEIVVVYEAQPWPDGKRGVGYLDGHARIETAAEWEKIKATVK